MNVLTNEEPAFTMLTSAHLPLITQELNYFFTHIKSPHHQTCIVDDRIQKAMDFIQAHYHESIQLNLVAREVGLNGKSLSRLFKKFVRCSYIDYITLVRVGHAMVLLRTSSNSIFSIMCDCGFYDKSTFTRAFRATIGMTPAAFRKSFTHYNAYTLVQHDGAEGMLQVAEHGLSDNELPRYQLLASNPPIGSESIEIE